MLLLVRAQLVTGGVLWQVSDGGGGERYSRAAGGGGDVRVRKPATIIIKSR